VCARQLADATIAADADMVSGQPSGQLLTTVRVSSSGSSRQRLGASRPPPFAAVHSPRTDEEQAA